MRTGTDVGAGARSGQQAQRAAEHDGTLGDGVIGDSGPAGEDAPQALQRARSQRARSRARLTLQNVAKDVPGSSSSHAAGAEVEAEAGAELTVSDATPLPASPLPSDRAAKRTSSIAANRQLQLNALMVALEEDSSCHSSDEGEHAARASSLLDEDFGDHPEEAACSPTSRRLSVGQAMSSPSI